MPKSPNRNGPPCPRQTVAARSRRCARCRPAHRRRASCAGSVRANIHRHLLAQVARNPACISALMLRAWPRAAGPRPHRVLREQFGQRLGMIASDSQTASPESVDQARHLPRRRMRENVPARVGLVQTDQRLHRNGMPKCLITSHGRIDQDEEFLSPITSFIASKRVNRKIQRPALARNVLKRDAATSPVRYTGAMASMAAGSMPSSGASGPLSTSAVFIESRLSREITGSPGADFKRQRLQTRQRIRQANDLAHAGQSHRRNTDEFFERIDGRAAQFVGTRPLAASRSSTLTIAFATSPTNTGWNCASGTASGITGKTRCRNANWFRNVVFGTEHHGRPENRRTPDSPRARPFRRHLLSADTCSARSESAPTR